MEREPETTEVTLAYLNTTQKSVLFDTGKTVKVPNTHFTQPVQVSIPKSLIVDYKQMFGGRLPRRGQTVEVEIPVWLAIEKGLI